MEFSLPIAVGGFNGNVHDVDFNIHGSSPEIKRELQSRT